MKKLFCLFFAVLICFSFTACKDKENNEATIDLEYYASLGQIPECEYTLGSSPSDIEADLSKKAAENEEFYYSVDDRDDAKCISDGTYNFYYKADEEKNGISYIASLDSSYGFEIGTISIEIKNALGDTEYTEEKITEENTFFLLGMHEGSVLKCKFETNTVMFVFVDNALCATAIYTNDWE